MKRDSVLLPLLPGDLDSAFSRHQSLKNFRADTSVSFAGEAQQTWAFGTGRPGSITHWHVNLHSWAHPSELLFLP